MNKQLIQKITYGGLCAAIVCVTTAVIQIPIPLGYMHFGNISILLFAYLFSPDIALFAGGVGSALADLITGYPQWILPTLIIKSLMGFLASELYHKKGAYVSLKSIRCALGSLVGIATMVIGYTLFGCFLYGNLAQGLAQIPGLSTEGIFGIIGFYLLAAMLVKVPFIKRALAN